MRTLLLALLLLLPVTPAHARPNAGLEIRFDIRARDSLVGKGRIVVGPRLAGGRHGARPVLVEGRSEDLAAVLYRGHSEATSWVDAEWRPIAAHWIGEFLRHRSVTVARYTGRHVVADFRRGDHTVHVDRQLDEAPQDLVSLVPWLMQQKLKEGQRLAGAIYLGADVCRFAADVRPAERQETVRGTRQGLPVDVQLDECRIRRHFTVWLDAADWTPLRLRVAESMVGTVDLVLTGIAPVQAAWPSLLVPVTER